MVTTRRQETLEIPVRTVGVDIVRGTLVHAPRGPLEKLTIGTAEGVDVRFDEPSVSRFHAELSVRSGAGVHVRDLGSTNGVVTGKTHIDEAVVPSGSLIELGGACIRVTRGAAAHAPISATTRLGALITESPAMRRLAHRIEALASGDLPILVEGAPGSGKELVARTLHGLSPLRANKPFVVVDCGTLSDALGASELFGHERGAFTDAGESRAGAFELAGGGALVLDEVSRLSPSLQPALLGVLERKRFRRLGGNRELTVGARVIATSSLDLRKEVNQGRFRLDLHYRLAGVRLEVPALRDRADDLPALVAELLGELGHGSSHPLASEGSISSLVGLEWSQNVRELRAHLLSRATLGEEDSADSEDDDAAETLPELVAALTTIPYKEARARFERRFETAYLRHLAELARGSVSAGARLSGLDRAQLRTLARRAGVTLKKC